MRLLVVDDNAVFREELGELLGSDGHSVELASSVVAAVEILERGGVDVVLTDLKMPRETGLDLLRIVRDRWPSVTAVMITGRAGVETAVEAMRLGAFDYIAKPFRPDQLRELLRLAEAERRFVRTASSPRSPEELVAELTEAGTAVLVVSASAAGSPNATRFRFDGVDLSALGDAVDSFVRGHPKGAIVLAETERLLEHHRLEDVTRWIAGLQVRMASAGPLILAFDPARVPESAATAMRAVVAGPAVHGALEAVSNPFRRRVLARLERGPASFTDAMRAAGLDDSPKMSFHLHRLLDAGLIGRSGEDYRLTPSGTDAVATLHHMERAAASAGGHDQLLASSPSGPTPRRKAGRLGPRRRRGGPKAGSTDSTRPT